MNAAQRALGCDALLVRDLLSHTGWFHAHRETKADVIECGQCAFARTERVLGLSKIALARDSHLHESRGYRIDSDRIVEDPQR